MREIISLNRKWAFSKMAESVPSEINPKWDFVNLPHSWNGIDGQDGGYSTWRVDLTSALREDNLLAIAVDNAPNETVYPQMADFTFYGGLYRDVNLIAVPASHFDLGSFGCPGRSAA